MSEHSCPALADLLAEPQDEQVERHLAECSRCRALLAAAPNPVGHLSLDASALSTHNRPTRPDRAGEPGPGTIGRFRAEGSEFALTALILSVAGPLLKVAPIDTDVRAAAEWDLMLPVSVLSYPALAALDAVHEVRREQLLDTRALLDAPLWRWAQKLVENCESGEPVPAEAPVGYPVLSAIDPRLRTRAELGEARKPFWAAAELLGASESFGALIRHRREALEVDITTLEELIEAPGWLDRLEADRLDINGELPTRAMARLMRRLGIRPLRLVLDQLRIAIEAHAEGLSGTTRFARRRTAARRAAVRPEPEERRGIADNYLANLTSALEEL